MQEPYSKTYLIIMRHLRLLQVLFYVYKCETVMFRIVQPGVTLSKTKSYEIALLIHSFKQSFFQYKFI